MNFENRPTHSLRPYAGNARTHSPKQIKQIARSIERFGFNNPVLVDDDDQIIAGHGRVEAAKLLGLKTVPTVRLSHLSETEKKAYILADNRLAEKAGWDKPLPAGRFRGIAVLFAFESYAAQVVEISVNRSARTLKVHRIVCAVDVGRVVNPATIAAQSESGVVYGLSAALHGEITLSRGRVEQTNFNQYPVLRMNEMPAIEVHIVPSEERPTGAGELSVPPVAAALCNALFAATGKRIRRLPIRPEDLA